jgi:hypothetical protein
MAISEGEIKAILNDPKRMLDLIRTFHNLLHLYEIEQLKKNTRPNERLGLSDSVELILKDSKGNIKEERKV